MSFFNELKRRNVFRVAVGYIVVAWLMLQVADVVLNNIEAPGWVFQAIMLVLGIGFPLVLVFAWAFEMTPEGLKRESEVDRSQSITHKTGRKLDYTIFAVMAIALTYFIWESRFKQGSAEMGSEPFSESSQTQVISGENQNGDPNPTGTPFNKSIAVLPFADMSPDKDQEYFTDGISEELLNLLAKIPQLQVAARTSSFQFKGQTGDIATIAQQLKVANILEGSVRKAGKRVRITAQLIQADSGYHLWSETWDRTLDDVFAIQDEISSAVVDALKVTLLGEAPHAVETDPEAYALFLQGRFLFNQRTGEAWWKAEEAYKKSLAIDPDYAAAWAGLSEVQNSLAGYGHMDLDAGMTQALQSVEKALEIDPELGVGWAILSAIYSNYNWDYKAADNAMNRALELEPNNATVLFRAGDQARFMGRFEEAVIHYKKAITLDPVNSAAYGAIQGTLLAMGRFEESEKYSREVINLNPLASAGHANLAYHLMRKGQFDEALAEAELETDEVWKAYVRFQIYHEMGNKTQADAILEQFIAQHHEAWAFQVADLYAVAGDSDKAFEWLEIARQQRDPGFAWSLSAMQLRSLHDDPRWEPMLEQVGLLKAWQEMPNQYKAITK